MSAGARTASDDIGGGRWVSIGRSAIPGVQTGETTHERQTGDQQCGGGGPLAEYPGR